MFRFVNDINQYTNEYKSCGIILTKNTNGKNYWLFVIESRKDYPNPVVHIIGGKKEPGEYPHETIARETWEETAHVFSQTDCVNQIFSPNTSKYWYNRGKYILYIGNCPDQYHKIDVDFAHTNPESTKLVWISNEELVSNVKNKTWEFTDSAGNKFKYSDLLISAIENLST